MLHAVYINQFIISRIERFVAERPNVLALPRGARQDFTKSKLKVFNFLFALFIYFVRIKLVRR